jgi:hypothetical protein
MISVRKRRVKLPLSRGHTAPLRSPPGLDASSHRTTGTIPGGEPDTCSPCLSGYSTAPAGSFSFVAKRSEQRTEEQIQVRQVTHVQASWTEQDRGGDGAFTFQLILDNGADEYVLRPTAEDADVLLKLLKRSDTAMFDLDRKVLMFNNLTIS